MRLRPLVAAAALLVGAALPAISAPPARAAVVERIVAVVGEQPILLSELRQRARPALARIYANVPPAGQSVAVAEMYKELLSRLVEELVVSQSADKLGVVVTTKELDDTIRLQAAEMKISVAELLVEAQKSGITEADFREGFRRELLFEKMLETRVRARVRPTEDDAKAYYKRVVVSERKQQTFRVSILALDLPSGKEGIEKRALADKLVKTARAGSDFSVLAKAHSIDGSRDKGGDLGTQHPGALGKSLDEAALRLDVNEVSDPVVVGARIVVLKVTEREKSTVPAYDDVRDVVFAKVREEMLAKQKRAYLDELRAGVFIDIRL